MAKRESTFTNMVLALFLVTLVSAAVLGFVNDLTKADIEAAKMKAQQDAIKAVLPAFDRLGDAVMILPAGAEDSVEVFAAYNGETMIGLAVNTSSEKGFSGHIGIMAGLDLQGNITGYEVLEHKETPGLGSKMGVWFRNPDKPTQNVIGKNPGTMKFEVKKDGGEIDAITASTITSRAFLEALVKAYDVLKAYQSALSAAAVPAATPADSSSVAGAVADTIRVNQ